MEGARLHRTAKLGPCAAVWPCAETRTLRGLPRFFGLSREAASIAALGRDPEPSADPHDRTVANTLRGLGLSESAAEIAADGRDGPSSRPVSEAPAGSSSWLKPGDNERLISIIEQWQQDLLARGQLCIERGETRELAALREAWGKVLLSAPNDLRSGCGCRLLSGRGGLSF